MKAHGDFCGLFSFLSQNSKQGSHNDNEIVASFLQQFSGNSYVIMCL